MALWFCYSYRVTAKLRKDALRKNLKYTIPVILGLLLALGYIGRGFIRKSVLPHTALILHKNSLDESLKTTRNEIQDMYTFGQIKYIEEVPTYCSLSDAYIFKTEVICSNYLFRGQVSIKDISMEEFKIKAEAFEKSLTENGWKPVAHYSPLPVPENTSRYWHRVPYEKQVNDNTCVLRVERDEDPNLLDAYLNCDRRVTFF